MEFLSLCSLRDARLSSLLGSDDSRVAAEGKSIAVARGAKLALMTAESGALHHEVVDQEVLAGDAVSCLAFVSVAQSGRVYLACGTTGGWLRWFGLDGKHIMGHHLHSAAVVRIRSSSHSLCVLFRGGIVAVAPSESLAAALSAASIRSGPLAGAPATLSFHKYEAAAQRLVHDVFSCKVSHTPPRWSLRSRDLFDKKQSSQQQDGSASNAPLELLCVGAFPMLAVYYPSADRSTLSSAVALASQLTTKLTTAVFSMARSWWSSGNDDPSPAPSPQKAAPSVAQEAQAIDVEECLDDANREIRVALLSPCETLAVCCDVFGRVLLLDLRLNLIIRVWKGYREAQVAWMAPAVAGDEEPLLVIYAPRRGILEVWSMRHGPREGNLDVGVGCSLISGISCCFLLRANGELQRIQFSAALSQQLQEDQKTLLTLKSLVSKQAAPEEILKLLQKIRHAKVTVQAILALSASYPSSFFQDAIAAALESHKPASEQNKLLTPGVSEIMSTEDVTHLVWLDRYVRAFRILEGIRRTEPATSSSVSCRQFLSCFCVVGPSEARLSKSIPAQTRKAVSAMFFSAADADAAEQVLEALRWTRLAVSDTEAMFADFWLDSQHVLQDGQTDLATQVLQSLLKRRPLIAAASSSSSSSSSSSFPSDLPPSSVSPLLELQKRVVQCTNLVAAGRVVDLALRCLGADDTSSLRSAWADTKERLAVLEFVIDVVSSAAVSDSLFAQPSLALCESGGFCLARVMALFHAGKTWEGVAKSNGLTQGDCVNVFEKLKARFPEVASLPVFSVYVCVEVARAWCKELERVAAEKNNIDDDDPAAQQQDLAPSQSVLQLTSAIFESLQSVPAAFQGPTVLTVWNTSLKKVFWNIAALMDRVGGLPSENVLRKSLGLSSVELKEACSAFKQVLQMLTNSWSVLSKPRVADVELPFPSVPTSDIKECFSDWDSRSAVIGLDELRPVHQLARVMNLVVSGNLRNVHVLCVLPLESKFREEVEASRNAEKWEAQRKRLVERLFVSEKTRRFASTLMKEFGINVRTGLDAIVSDEKDE